MQDERGRATLRWRGIMADSPMEVRRAAIAFLAITACAMVATQTNYFVIGGTHLIAGLAPITACALLYGPVPAAVVGALAGAAEMIHAQFLPLDTYEMYFASPVNSILLFALMGLVMGAMFAQASTRTGDDDRKGLIAISCACVLGSFLFTFLFSVSVNVINALLSFKIPSEIISDFTNNREVARQVLVDSAMMVGLSLAAGAVDRKRKQIGSSRTLRETFQGWLAVVMATAYLITASLGYTAVSAACRGNAEREMQAQLTFLSGQLAERDESDGAGLASLTHNLPTDGGEVVAVAKDGTIVSSTVDAFVGRPFEEVVAGGIAEGFDESLYQQTRSTYWYFGQEGLAQGSSKLGFIRVAQDGTYQLMAALPASQVFAWRPWMMLAVSATFLLLFAAMYTQASILLRNVVVSKIDETNQALLRITQGDLDERVSVQEPAEFATLSRGINVTVGSLKDAIAAESNRIEGDLKTARAIQESSLPRTFPPYPEIEKFDIYASMAPAREVGGDFYDFFLIDDHTLGFLIADVSGKGIPAALFMMAAKAELATYVGSGMDLAAAVQTANWHLCQNNDANMFMTAWVATLNWESGLLTFVNAGHNPPLLRHEGAWHWLMTRGGPLIGCFDSSTYRSTSMTLDKNDQLLLYTDGVNEAYDANGMQYGEHRLERLCAQNPMLHPRELIEAVGEDVRSWAEGTEQSDDVTMLSVEYGVAPESNGSITVPATIGNLEKVIALVHDELARRLCPISTQHQVDIALEELFVNVCSYAYADEEGPGDCCVSYQYRAEPSTITVSLADWGVPFNPLDQQDPTLPSSVADAKIGGLGIFMTKRLTDDLSYKREGDMNVVTFKKSW